MQNLVELFGKNPGQLDIRHAVGNSTHISFNVEVATSTVIVRMNLVAPT